MDGNHAVSAKAKGCLTARLTGRAGTKVGFSDPVVLCGNNQYGDSCDDLSSSIKSNQIIQPNTKHMGTSL